MSAISFPSSTITFQFYLRDVLSFYFSPSFLCAITLFLFLSTSSWDHQHHALKFLSFFSSSLPRHYDFMIKFLLANCEGWETSRLPIFFFVRPSQAPARRFPPYDYFSLCLTSFSYADDMMLFRWNPNQRGGLMVLPPLLLLPCLLV